MKMFTDIIPHTGWGRVLFLLFLNRIFAVVWFSTQKFLGFFVNFFENFEKGCFNISSNQGWASFCVENVFYFLSIFLNIGVFEIAIVWLLVYCVFRFTRNRNFIGKDFFWVSVVASAILYLTHILASYLYGDLKVSFFAVTMFFACSLSAYFIFKFPDGEKELPKEYLKRLFSVLLKSKLVWGVLLCCFFINFLSGIIHC